MSLERLSDSTDSELSPSDSAILDSFEQKYGASHADDLEKYDAPSDGDVWIGRDRVMALLGPEVSIAPDSSQQVLGVELSCFDPASGCEEFDKGYMLSHVEGHTSKVQEKYVERAADLFDTTVETILERAKVRETWGDFPVLIEAPESDLSVFIAPYIGH